MISKFKALLVALTLLALLTVPAARAADSFGIDSRPSPSGFVHANWLTATGAFRIPGSTTINFDGGTNYILAAPLAGFGLGMRTGGTNSSDTTNLVIVLEGVLFPTGSRSGGTQVVDNATLTVSTPTTATTLPSGYDYVTNFYPNSTPSLIALDRVDGIRIRSIQNTNLNSIWITNLFQLRD